MRLVAFPLRCVALCRPRRRCVAAPRRRCSMPGSARRVASRSPRPAPPRYTENARVHRYSGGPRCLRCTRAMRGVHVTPPCCAPEPRRRAAPRARFARCFCWICVSPRQVCVFCHVQMTRTHTNEGGRGAVIAGRERRRESGESGKSGVSAPQRRPPIAHSRLKRSAPGKRRRPPQTERPTRLAVKTTSQRS